MIKPHNPEKRKEYKNRYNAKNTVKIKEYSASYYQKTKNYQLEKNKNYYNRCSNQILLKRKIRRTIDFSFCVKNRIGNNLRDAFRRFSTNGKVMSSKKYGIDYAAIFQKLGEKPEGNFHIDHIIPISVFNLDNPEHVRLSHHPENLRWLDSVENIRKSDSIDWSLIESNEVLSNIAKEIGLKKET